MAQRQPTPDPRPITLFGPTDPIPAESALKSKLIPIKVRTEFRPDRARGAARPAETVVVQPDDVIEIQFDEGQRLWIQGGDYRRQFKESTARDATGREMFVVPESFDMLPRGMQSRGPVKWAIKSLKVLGIDLEKKTAKEIGAVVDGRKATNRPGLGLYRCSLETDRFRLTPADGAAMPADKPYLLFIHGTASSTWGSFGSLWASARMRELNSLRNIYGERVLAFEHASISVSPIANAIALVKALPPGAKLHIVSHSRGGLVGELLCRAGSAAGPKAGTQPFSDIEIELFKGEAYKDSREQLKELNGLLKKPQFTVDRFVRVGCPALGTTLASRRLDRWLSIMGSVAGAMPDTPLADVFTDIGDFAAAVIKERTNPSTLPGLEAMMPESAMIKLVNWPTTTVAGDLVVIAGDIEPDAWWAKLLVFATDRFYDGDHDLVVNTPSMYGGAKRAGTSLVSYHKGPGVNHFTYFSNQASVERLVQALTGPDAAGFEPLKKPAAAIARAIVPRSVEPRPVVFVLPGIMGSELTVGRQPVWVDIPGLLLGGLRKLNIEAKNIQATQPLVQFYGDLLQFLARTHKVIPFPFDWRLPVEKEADRLMELVRTEAAEAARQNQPVRFLAHSMGGLVVRTMIARHHALWRDISSHQGARFVMLGTPNGGSHAITELLVGQSSLFSKLAFVDVKNSQAELLGIVSRFPGILAMLPIDAAEDYFSSATWNRYVAGETALVAPADADLARAREFRRLLDSSPIDPRKMVYVAGRADVTVTRMYYDVNAERANEFIKFTATTRGDGRVTWDSGIPPEVPTWYMDVEHGDLPAHQESFPAFLDLLETGTTARLSKVPPVARAADDLFPRPPVIDDFYPAADDLAASALGAAAGRRKKTKRREEPTSMKVVHGNLAFATYPVAVGHYAGDTIISAEAALDRMLEGELSRRAALGLYPGALETCAVVVHPRCATNPTIRPQGGVVIGLGTPGFLTAAEITRTFLKAMLQYALEWTASPKTSDPATQRACDGKLGISALLIGTNAGGVSVSDSVYAMAKAVARANETLAEAKQPQRIVHVEFIELWEDRAILAVKAFEDCEADPALRGKFVFDPDPDVAEGGLRRVTFEEPGGWWHRVQILGGDEGDPMRRTLRFAASTRRARSEVSLLPTQRTLVDRFVAEAIRSTHDNRSVSRTLFELLLPNPLKVQAPDQDDIILLLDEAAAQYPWELLADPGGPERRPFAIEHGVLRQLETMEFTDTVRPVTDKAALVIGDPISSFVELKGAQVEADAVTRSLQDSRFRVELRKRATGDQVMQALYARPYQILHLAGHGVYRYLPKQAGQCGECGQELTDAQRMKELRTWQPITGMVIGDDAFLTPAEVKQLTRVPDLVFINCCHLGRIEPSGNTKLNSRDDYNKIAANVATEFIRMGVRVVVAAGWAVDDAAALTFSTTFYNRLLSGAVFGDAVKAARQATYEAYPQSNTWGAYQCYGDPAFRLMPNEGVEDGTEGKITFASPVEAVAELDNIAARLCAKAGEDQQKERAQLTATMKAITEKRWLKDGRLCLAAARAYRDTGLFNHALHYYRRALAVDPSAVGMVDIEQIANLLSRRAVLRYESPAAIAGMPRKAGVPRNEQARRRGRSVGAPSFRDIDKAIDLINWLMERPDWLRERHVGGKADEPPGRQQRDTSGRTVERLCLLGSAYKRMAWVSPRATMALKQMSKSYHEAYELSIRRAKPDLYPLLNATAADMILAWAATRGGDRSRRRAGAEPPIETLNKAREAVSEAAAVANRFWTKVYHADLRLLEALVQNKLDRNALGALADEYAEARKLANRRTFASVLDHLAFLRAMAAKLGSMSAAQGLEDLRKRLESASRSA
ncbi:MAG TPA: CHAT domain-containing protein [Nitrospiraceae bacterium]|nr:CHAT domain-containing protein [Nitrospiraceae bacterium]